MFQQVWEASQDPNASLGVLLLLLEPEALSDMWLYTV